jgi:SAM-dependent methyltransferase
LSNNALGDRKFDILTLFHVLEHVEDPGRELRHGLQYLQPGGHVIVQVPNFGSLQAAWFRSRWYGLDPPRHLTQFSPAGLRVLLESADLSIVSVYYFSLRDNAPAFVSSLFPGLDPIARRVRQQKVMLTNSGIEESLSLLTYMLLVFFVTPLALMESLARKGATLVVHARKPAD